MSEEVKITGKVSYDELDPELLKEIREGGNYVIDARFKVKDPKGEYANLGLGTEFTLPDFIRVVSELFKKTDDIAQYVQDSKAYNYSQKIDQINRKISNLEDENNNLKRTIAKLKEMIKDGSTEPVEPEIDPNSGYSDNKYDYIIENDENGIDIMVGENKVTIPTNMFVTEQRLSESSKKLNTTNSYLDENDRLIRELESINNSIND